MPDTTPTAETTAELTAQLAESLHKLADLVSLHPELLTFWERMFYFSTMIWDEDEVPAFLKAFSPVVRQDLAGEPGVKKVYGDEYAFLRCYLGTIPVSVMVSRSKVCTRRVVGTRTVTKEVPDPDAPKIVQTTTEEIVEWDCKPMMSAGSDPNAELV